MPQQHTKQRSSQIKMVDVSLGFDFLARNSRSTIGRQWECSFYLSLPEKSHEGMLHSYRCCDVAWLFDVPLLPWLNKGNSPKDPRMWRPLYKGKTDMILLVLVHQLVERILNMLFPLRCPSSGLCLMGGRSCCWSWRLSTILIPPCAYRSQVWWDGRRHSSVTLQQWERPTKSSYQTSQLIPRRGWSIMMSPISFSYIKKKSSTCAWWAVPYAIVR